MKNFKHIIIIMILMMTSQYTFSQMIKTNATSSGGSLQLEKRMATTDDFVGIGEVFYYEISFLESDRLVTPNTTIEITDVLPAGLEYISYQALFGTFFDANGTQVNFNSTSSPVMVTGQTATGKTITFSNLDDYSKGVFRIKVRFPDTACDGDRVINNVCAAYGDKTTGDIENLCTISGLETIVEGIDPWENAVVTKVPLYPAIFDANNDWYIDINNPIVKYKITVEKELQYSGSTTGMLSLNNIKISDILLPGGVITNVSPGYGYTLSPSSTQGPDIDITGSWSGNIDRFKKEFIIDVDYSGSALFLGQTITNNAILTGRTCLNNTINVIDSANVIVTDTLPIPLSAVNLSKTVGMTNRVIGCLGKYTIRYQNNNNTKINNVVILDNLPDDIEPLSIGIRKSINSASTTDTFSMKYNGVSPVDFANTLSAGNTLEIRTDPGTELYPNGDYIEVDIFFRLRSTSNTTAGGIVNNCANATGDLYNPITAAIEHIPETSCVSFKVVDPEPKICVDKQVRKIQPGATNNWTNNIADAKPGDDLEFRIRIINYGSSPFTGTLTDLLDPKFIFQNFVNTPSGINANQVANPLGLNLDWSNINIGASCTVSIGGCSTAYPHVDLVFRVKVAPYTPAGLIVNTATVDGNIPNPIPDTANVRVVNSFVIKITKEISENGLVWTDYLVETPFYTGPIQYRLKVENIGNMPLLNHEIYDELPMIGDKLFPGGPNRGSDFSLTNPTLVASPNYIATLLNNQGGVTNCGDTPPSRGVSTIKYESNSILNPADVFIIRNTHTLPSGLSTGNIAVNNAYYLDCNGNTNIIEPSNRAVLEIYEPPCETCPEGTEWEGRSISNTVITIPETGVHSELDGIPVYNEDIQLKTNWQWVTGVRIVMSEFEPIYKDGCESCHFNMDQVGNLVNNMFPAQLGQLTKVATDYHGANKDFVREIVYKGSPDISFRNGISTNIAISLPDMINPDCCVVEYRACIKYIFEGPNCENCELEYCFTTPDGPIHPPLCEDATVEIVELGKPQSNCCEKVLMPYIRPCKIGATYQWFNSQGIQVASGTTNANNNGSFTATENGDYTIKINCFCPDGSPNNATATYTVSGILAPLPTPLTGGVVSHRMQRYSSGNVYTATLDVGISPALYKYGFRIRVLQEYSTSFFGSQAWGPISNAVLSKDICSENGSNFKLNFTYNRPGSLYTRITRNPSPFFGGNLIEILGTWQDNYKIVIEWEGCDGVAQSIDYPITNLPPIKTKYIPFTGRI